MAYYQGDYYVGDYYKGDPFWGSLASFALGGIGSLFGRKKKAATKSAAMVPVARTALSVARSVIPGIAGGVIGSRAGGAAVSTALQRVPGMRGTIQRLLPGGETGYLPKRRRMNPANPRALRRSLRRVAGFGKLAARARRDVRRAASAIGANPRGRGPVARHHARIRAKA
jgi:hypothetical protein